MVTSATEDGAQDRGPGRLALGAALTLALSFAAPALQVAVQTGGIAGIHIGHAETFSLTTYGRWWVWPPHHFMTDGFSGDLATFYNFLSDTLLNLGAAVTGLAPMTFQAFVYGPLLGFLFVWLGYLSLASALRDRWTAALAAAIAAFTVDPWFARPLLGQGADDLVLMLHFPFHALGLGNGQSLGWVLFFPATCLLFTARERFTPRRATLHGVCLGLLFLAHTLTFINVACIEITYLTVRRALSTSRDRPWVVWAGGMVVLAVGLRLLRLGPAAAHVCDPRGSGGERARPALRDRPRPALLSLELPAGRPRHAPLSPPPRPRVAAHGRARRRRHASRAHHTLVLLHGPVDACRRRLALGARSPASRGPPRCWRRPCSSP